jgi:hypothetical protein
LRFCWLVAVRFFGIVGIDHGCGALARAFAVAARRLVERLRGDAEAAGDGGRGCPVMIGGERFAPLIIRQRAEVVVADILRAAG